MSLEIRFLLTMLGIFPAIVCVWKYKNVDRKFHPFIFMMWLDVLAEIIDFLLQKIPSFKQIGYAIVNSYTILNFFLFLLLAFNFSFISKIKLKIFFSCAIIIGITEFILIHPLGILFYLLFYVSIIMLAISIDTLTKQIMAIKEPLANNFWFWMGGAFVFYNTHLLLIFSAYFFVIRSNALGYIFTFVNASCYILLGIASLKIPIRFKAEN